MWSAAYSKNNNGSACSLGRTSLRVQDASAHPVQVAVDAMHASKISTYIRGAEEQKGISCANVSCMDLSSSLSSAATLYFISPVTNYPTGMITMCDKAISLRSCRSHSISPDEPMTLSLDVASLLRHGHFNLHLNLCDEVDRAIHLFTFICLDSLVFTL